MSVAPGLISASCAVPADVPSLRQGSMPVPSSAAKTKLPSADSAASLNHSPSHSVIG
jgi:hypothetical protein